MPDPDPTPGGAPRAPDWSTVALDWIDLLVIVTFSVGLTLLFGALGWRPSGAAVGAASGPLLIAALALRRRVLPPRRRGPALKRLSAVGVLATLLMLGGLLAGVFGAFGAWARLGTRAAPIDEQEVQAVARAAAQVALTPVVEPLTDDAAAAARPRPTGTFEELVAEIERGPSAEAIGAQATVVRRQLQAESEERAAARRADATRFALRATLLAVALIALGGLLDARRPRAA